MNAIAIDENGGVEVLNYTSVPKPTASSDQVLVKTTYSTVNFIDCYFRSGLYKVDQFPYILGSDGSGVIEQVGDGVKDLKVGDSVAFFGRGSYAEYVPVSEKSAVKIPEGISMETAAACMVNGLTGYYLTHETYKVQKGDYVLVHAAAGGTGQYIVQLAKHLGGVVIGTVGSDEKIQIAKEMGCDHVINYKTQDVVQQVQEITNGQKCRVSYDGIGKTTFETSLNSLGPRGWFVSFGNASGAAPLLNPLDLTSRGSLIFTRPSLAHHVPDRATFVDMSNKLFSLVKQGVVKVNIHKTFDLKDTKEAHLEIQGAKTLGKILLKV
ncbi:hypothetical protein AKO1_012651 [Acrasis kona]|uniref:Probable quinone oxidoreductase n=1 Tax=Acrasis kona TaxID=1008807 RepID=A0AAW2YWU9_9EUKA